MWGAGLRGLQSLAQGAPDVLILIYCSHSPQSLPGPATEGCTAEFLGLWDRMVGQDIMSPPPPQCFRIQGQDPQDRVKWSEAQFSCEQQEAQLVTIANPLEQGRASPWEGPSIL